MLASVYQRYDWNWHAADSEYRLALAGNPGLALAHQWYSGLLSILRLPDDAILESLHTRQLEPLSLPANTAYASMLYRARRYQEAVAQFEFTLKLSPEYQPALVALGFTYCALGAWDAAIRVCEQAANLSNNETWTLSALGYALGRGGYRDRALAIASELDAAWPAKQFWPSQLAQVHQGLGNLEATFLWLGEALVRHDPALTILRADPSYDNLRQDARYERIVRQLNL